MKIENKFPTVDTIPDNYFQGIVAGYQVIKQSFRYRGFGIEINKIVESDQIDFCRQK